MAPSCILQQFFCFLPLCPFGFENCIIIFIHSCSIIYNVFSQRLYCSDYSSLRPTRLNKLEIIDHSFQLYYFSFSWISCSQNHKTFQAGFYQSICMKSQQVLVKLSINMFCNPQLFRVYSLQDLLHVYPKCSYMNTCIIVHNSTMYHSS